MKAHTDAITSVNVSLYIYLLMLKYRVMAICLQKCRSTTKIVLNTIGLSELNPSK